MSPSAGSVSIYYPRALVGDGGVTNAVWLWAESLRGAGLPVQVVHAPVSRDGRPRQAATGIVTRSAAHRGSGRWQRPERFADQLDGSALLVLHSGYVLANLVAARAARRHGVPYVVVPHGAYDPHVRARRRVMRSTWELAERRLLRRAAAVHVFLPAEVDHVHALAPGAKTVQAPTAFPVPDVRWAADRHDGYVAWLGRYDIRHKGIDLLLDAMALLPPAERPTLLMRGRDSTDSRRNVQALVSARGLDSFVDVGPPIDGRDKEAFLLAASAYVHASRWESYGLALVEAMAYGIPCLTTSDAGLGPQLLAARAAHVVPGVPQGLADGLRGVGHDDQAVGARGRDWVSRHLNHEAAARQLLDQLEALGVRTPL